MTQELLSVGIDIGTSTTQLIFSRLTLENRANPLFGAADCNCGQRGALPKRDSLYPLLRHGDRQRGVRTIGGGGTGSRALKLNLHRSGHHHRRDGPKGERP